MHSAFLCLVSAMALPAVEKPALEIQMEKFPDAIQLGDLVIVKVTVENLEEEPVLLPETYNRVLGTLHYELTHQHSPYSFDWSNDLGHGVGLVPMEPLHQGESRVVVWDALEFPPIAQIERDYWSELSGMQKPAILNAVMAQAPTPALRAFVPAPTLKRRSDAEVDRLIKAYVEKPAEPIVYGTRPVPADFGLWSYPVHMATPQRLADLEEHLSDGTLRDVIEMTRHMQLIAITDDGVHLKDAAARRASCRELLDLLDSSQEFEREWLARRALLWFSSRTTKADEVEEALIQDIAKRLPEARKGTTPLIEAGEIE